MPSTATLEAFIAMVEAGQHVQAVEAYYTEDSSMRENMKPPRLGRAAHAEAERRAMATTQSVFSQCVRPVLTSGDHVVIRWIFRFERHDGSRLELEELAWQRWQGERIAEEQFFYDPVQLRSGGAAS